MTVLENVMVTAADSSIGQTGALNESRNTLLAARLEQTHSFFSRVLGLLGRQQLEEGCGMLFSSTPWLRLMWMHTFGMRFSIDIIFLDRDSRVLRINHSLQPWRVSSPVFGAWRALEIAGGSAERSGTRVGDQILITTEVIMPAERKHSVIGLQN